MSKNYAGRKSFECKTLSATGEKRFSMIRNVSRDSSQSLLLGHACQATAVWQFSVVIWKRGSKVEISYAHLGWGCHAPAALH